MFGRNTDTAAAAKRLAYTSQIQLLVAQRLKVKAGLEWWEQLYFTIMLSFYVLIGLHKVPELLLALLCQELTEEEKDEGGSFMSRACIYDTLSVDC